MNTKSIILLNLILLFLFVNCVKTNNLINVQDNNSLLSAIDNAKPGDEIVLNDGVWNNVQLVIRSKGTKNKPIIIRAENEGKVFIEGESFIKLSGEFVIIEGLVFRNGFTPERSIIKFAENTENVANNCTVRNCVIDGFNQLNRTKQDHWIEFWGKNNILEKCYIAGKTNQGPTIRIYLKGNQSINNYHKIINNHFGPRPRKGGPRGETIQLGDSYTSMTPSHTLVANNYFEECNGEVEVISSKTNFNEFRNNVFYKSEGSLVTRHGNYCIIDGNIFVGDEHSSNYGGIRIINTGHWVTNNYFYKLRGTDFRAPIAIMNGIPKSPLNRYNQVTDLVIAHNTWIDCESPFQIGVGNNISQKDVLPKSEIRSARPIRTVIANNVIHNSFVDDQIIKQFDKLDGIKFKNNYVENGGDKSFSRDGFIIKELELAKYNDYFYLPKSGFENLELYIGYDFEKIDKDILSNSRKNKNLPGAICESNGLLDKILDKSNYGPQWYSRKQLNSKGKKYKVNTVEELYSSINNASSGDTIIVFEGEYNLDKPLKINKELVLSGELNKVVQFNYSGPEQTPLFEMNPKGNIKISNVKLFGTNSQYTFATLKNNMSDHYNIHLTDCTISDFDYVLKAYKETFADSIIFKNSKISNCNNGIELSEEIDDKGDYNAEFIIVDKCEFNNVRKNVIDYYRGGYDESTIGGNLLVSNSSFKNCGAKEENHILLNTRGIINVDISNNLFQDNDVKLVALLWGAKNNKHSNNTIKNSGSIRVEENLKLKLIY